MYVILSAYNMYGLIPDDESRLILDQNGKWIRRVYSFIQKEARIYE